MILAIYWCRMFARSSQLPTTVCQITRYVNFPLKGDWYLVFFLPDRLDLLAWLSLPQEHIYLSSQMPRFCIYSSAEFLLMESCCLVATGLKLWRDLVLHIVILSLSKLASGLLLSAHGSFSHGPTASLKFYQFSVHSLCSICWALPASPMNAGSMVH